MRAQLVVFALLGAVSLAYGITNYIGVQRITGIGTYSVTADFTESGALYPGGIVTYRGIDIGLVKDVTLTDDGVRAHLQLDSSISVPDGTRARVRSMSAIGEQYVDLMPEADAGVYLTDGSSIPVERTAVPVQVSALLNNTQSLLSSIPKDSLRTVIDESADAFGGTGSSLARLIESSGPLLELAQAEIGPTKTLVTDLEPLLETGNEIKTDLQNVAGDLASFTEQLALNDSQIRQTLESGPAFANAVAGTLRDVQPTLPILLSNLHSVGQVLSVNVPQLQQILVVYPAFSSAANYSVSASGFQTDDDIYKAQVPLDVKLGNTLNPLPCTEGYQGTQRRDPGDTSPQELAGAPYCTLPQGDRRVARGARNVPCATDSSVRTADIAECPRGLPSTWDSSVPPTQPQNHPIESGTPAAVPYDPISGKFRALDGQSYTIDIPADSQDVTKEAESWQDMLIN
ncbi:MCE family protein [Rhodococcus sp. NPDC059968]|uniref:MCE family protein n=1 Tax=Rhodococcus sp. NPDC059968 TaxID=3347017 RepID=UPI0036717951